ncbi:MAG TPA: 16S rRNA (adenine(1518)-N(6)/adenine(1519)-N(6))-dimethyltransferase RsmA [Nevskiaceae bacterium]|nr:16S rRNA (adenine(1518)-N(6)/adenine(1519)-N(6))-dimethyltransferase RsmA [Nevskiaceae bacterium]
MNQAPLPRARKRFGQHFLRDPAVVDRILRTIAPRAGEHLVEIGPGPGVLTRPLLASGARLDAIELDRDLVARLHDEFDGAPSRFCLHAADALRFDYTTLADDGPLRLVGNLPYNISTPLIFHLLQASDYIRDMHFMLQKEVVDRLTAAPGSRDYGRLSVAVAARAQATALFDVDPQAFTPPPKVWSSVVRITPCTPTFRVESWDAFDRVLTTAFSQRRKTLANSLRKLLPAAVIQAAGIDPGLRAERLTPADFAHLAAHLPTSVGR